MNLFRKVGLVVIAVMFASSLVSPVSAQTKKDTTEIEYAKVDQQHRAPFGGPGMGAGLGAGLVICGAAYGFGRIGSAALESMARQPETAGRVQTAMIIIGALLEGATFFALIICIQLAGKA
jgi:F-type H+-transporting ATPase subunit c